LGKGRDTGTLADTGSFDKGSGMLEELHGSGSHCVSMGFNPRLRLPYPRAGRVTVFM
jgi:hypothetical protein